MRSCSPLLNAELENRSNIYGLFEQICRNITGETTLDKAIARLEAKGVVINSEMKKGFAKLYYYTNDEATGIRHALMDDGNVPTSDEAIYMLVVCSAFVNYLTKKNIQ